MFSLGSFADNVRAVPAQASEVHRQRNARQTRRSGRTHPFANWEAVVNVECESRSRFLLRGEDIFVRFEDQMVFNSAADLRIVTGGIDRIPLCPSRANPEIKAEGQSGSVKRRAKIGGSGRQADGEFSHEQGFRRQALGFRPEASDQLSLLNPTSCHSERTEIQCSGTTLCGVPL